MAAVIAMLQRMKLSAEAAGETTSATGQAISTIPDFAEMDKEGVDLVFRQLARPGGANAAEPGTQASRFQPLVSRLWLNVLLHQAQVKSRGPGSHLRQCDPPSSQVIEGSGVAREKPQESRHCSKH